MEDILEVADGDHIQEAAAGALHGVDAGLVAAFLGIGDEDGPGVDAEVLRQADELEVEILMKKEQKPLVARASNSLRTAVSSQSTS